VDFIPLSRFAVRSLDGVLQLLYTLWVAKKLIAVRVKEAHLAELERISKREDDSVSELIRKAIEDYLQRMRKK
jgi:hypothetical protein